MGLFREQALAAYANPDARGGLLRAAPPSGLALFVVIVGALGCAAAVAATTRVRSSIEGRGVVALERGPIVVRAANGGTITAVNVSAGQTLEVAGVLLAIDGAPIATTSTGHVEFVDVRVGDVVDRGAPLVEIVPDREPLVGHLLVPAARRQRLFDGQEVRIHVGAEIVGTATIADVSAQPISVARQAELFGTSASLAPSGPQLLVRVTLPTAAALTNGAPFLGEIPLESRSALSVLVPALAEHAGEDDDEAPGEETDEDGDDAETGEAGSGS